MFIGHVTRIAKKLINSILATSPSYWVAEWSGAANEYMSNSCAAATDGSVYVYGTTNNNGTNTPNFALTKFDKTGSKQWYKYFGATSGTEIAYGASLVVDTAGNTYTANWVNQSTVVGRSYDTATITKRDATGTIIWSKYLYPTASSTLNNSWCTLNIDSNNNLLFIGRVGSGGSETQCIVKLTSDGGVIWSKTINGITEYGGSGTRSRGVDPNGNLIVGTKDNTSGLATIIKINGNDGSIAWQKSASGNGYVVISTTTDSNGNVFGVFSTGSAYTLIKFDTSGVYQWAKTMPTNAVLISYIGGNIVTMGDDLTALSPTTGAVVWTKNIKYGSSSLTTYTGSNDSYKICQLNNSIGIVFAKTTQATLIVLPSDGKIKNGTYGNITINDGTTTSLTAASPTINTTTLASADSAVTINSVTWPVSGSFDTWTPTANQIIIDTGLRALFKMNTGSFLEETGRTVTRTNAVQTTDPRLVKSGTSAFYSDGTASRYLTIPYASDMALGYNREPFTVELWVKILKTVNANWHPLIGQIGTAPEWYIYEDGHGKLGWYSTDLNAGGFNKCTSTAVFTTNTGTVTDAMVTAEPWNHIALCYDGTNVTMYLNGVSILTAAPGTTSFNSTTNTKVIQIGTTDSPFAYAMDDVCITKGICKYKDTFTPPTTIRYDGTTTTPPSKLMAVGNGGTLLTSDDGITWTTKTTGTSNNITNIVFGNGITCYAGNNIQTSADLTSWTTPTSFAATALAYAKGMFVANAYNGSNLIAHSYDGKIWTTTTGYSSWLGAVLTNGNTFVMFDGTYVYYSSDSVSWTQGSTNLNGYTIVASNGYFFAIQNNSGGGMLGLKYSTDAITWTSLTTDYALGTTWSDLGIGSSIAYGNGKYVIVGSKGRTSYSTNLTTWTYNTTAASVFGTSTTINSVVFCAASQKFVAVGSGGKIATSPDGITWTAITSGTTQNLLSIISTESV